MICFSVHHMNSVQRPREAPGRRAALRRIDYGLLVLLGLPLLLLSVDTTWLFSYALRDYIDPWVYFGYFCAPRQHLQAFSSTYYGTRLPWIVPGSIVYGLLPPLVAAYILHLAFYYAAIISFYLILKSTVGRQAALLASILFGCHSFFLRAIGWDYVDGAGITYLLLTLLMLTCAAKSCRPYLWLGFAGMSYGCLIHTQLFLITFTPLIAIFYVFLNREYGRHSLVAGAGAFAIGSVALTLALGIINFSLGGKFLFFLPSLKAATGLVSGGNRWWSSIDAWLAAAVWLLLPLLALCGSVVLLLFPRLIKRSFPNRRVLLFYQVYFILNTSTFVAWELGGQPVLKHSFYSSYLLPTVFLAIGSQVAITVSELSTRRFLLLLSGVIVISFLAFICPLDSRWLAQMKSHLFLPLLLGVAGLVGIIANYRYWGRAAVLLVSLALAMVNVATSTRNWNPASEDQAFPKNSFLLVAKSVRTIKAMDPKAASLFWYNFDSPLGGISRAVASSYLWGWRLISERFPELGGEYQHPALHNRIVVLSNDKDVMEKADRSLARVGFRAQFLNERTIVQGPLNYKMTFLEVCSLSQNDEGSDSYCSPSESRMSLTRAH